MSFRSDNRALDEMRPVKITPDYIAMAEGSALIEVGHTRVICTASVEETVPFFMRNTGKGWITSEYAMLPRATLTRTPRESSKGRVGGRTHEIQRLIGRSLRAVTDMKKLGLRDSGSQPKVEFFATDSVEKFRRAGEKFMGRKIENVTHVELEG